MEPGGTNTNKKERAHEMESAVPPMGIAVWVQCDGYRCLAYHTKDGKWLTVFGNKEVKDVIRVLPFE